MPARSTESPEAVGEGRGFGTRRRVVGRHGRCSGHAGGSRVDDPPPRLGGDVGRRGARGRRHRWSNPSRLGSSRPRAHGSRRPGCPLLLALDLLHQPALLRVRETPSVAARCGPAVTGGSAAGSAPVSRGPTARHLLLPSGPISGPPKQTALGAIAPRGPFGLPAVNCRKLSHPSLHARQDPRRKLGRRSPAVNLFGSAQWLREAPPVPCQHEDSDGRHVSCSSHARAWCRVFG